MLSRLQYISQGETSAEQLKNISNALESGCNWIQLRFKNADRATLKQVAMEVRKLCTTQNATFIMNDHVELAEEVNADGVHLGLDDMPLAGARAILGNKIIGGTANTLDDVLKRISEKADYVGLGPLRFTTTKKKLSPALDFTGYSAIMKELSVRNLHIPVFAIGGVITDDVAPLIEAGCYGVAVSGAITNSTDRKKYVSQLKTLLHGQVENSR